MGIYDNFSGAAAAGTVVLEPIGSTFTDDQGPAGYQRR